MRSGLLAAFYLLFIIVMASAIKRKKDTINRQMKNAEYLNEVPKPSGQSKQSENRRKEHNHNVAVSVKAKNTVNRHMIKESSSPSVMEDRENDWLAKQRRAEKIAYLKMSDMFAMKIEHRNNCEAEMLKRFHEENCDSDKVDSGEK